MALCARVTTTKVDPSKLEEAIDTFNQHLLPAVARLPGLWEPGCWLTGRPEGAPLSPSGNPSTR